MRFLYKKKHNAKISTKVELIWCREGRISSNKWFRMENQLRMLPKNWESSIQLPESLSSITAKLATSSAKICIGEKPVQRLKVPLNNMEKKAPLIKNYKAFKNKIRANGSIRSSPTPSMPNFLRTWCFTSIPTTSGLLANDCWIIFLILSDS